jgi:hypothetical protein
VAVGARAIIPDLEVAVGKEMDGTVETGLNFIRQALGSMDYHDRVFCGFLVPTNIPLLHDASLVGVV